MPLYALMIHILEVTENLMKRKKEQLHYKEWIITFWVKNHRRVLVHKTKEHSKSFGLQHDIENFLTA